MEDFMEDFQKISKKALETPFWKISKSFMELFPCELGDPIAIKGGGLLPGWVKLPVRVIGGTKLIIIHYYRSEEGQI